MAVNMERTAQQRDRRQMSLDASGVDRDLVLGINRQLDIEIAAGDGHGRLGIVNAIDTDTPSVQILTFFCFSSIHSDVEIAAGNLRFAGQPNSAFVGMEIKDTAGNHQIIVALRIGIEAESRIIGGQIHDAALDARGAVGIKGDADIRPFQVLRGGRGVHGAAGLGILAAGQESRIIVVGIDRQGTVIDVNLRTVLPIEGKVPGILFPLVQLHGGLHGEHRVDIHGEDSMLVQEDLALVHVDLGIPQDIRRAVQLHVHLGQSKINVFRGKEHDVKSKNQILAG